MELRLSKIY